MIANYELRIYDAYGAYKFNLQDISNIEYSRKANDLGIATVTMSGVVYNITDFNRDDRLEIYRFTRKGTKNLVGNTCWFLRKQEVQIDSDCNTTIVLTFYDTIHLLTRRYVAWSGKLDAGYVSHLLEKYDTMLYLIMYFNYGPGTTSEILNVNQLNAGIPAQDMRSLNNGTTSTIQSWQIKPYSNDKTGTLPPNVADLANRRLPIILPVPQVRSTLTKGEQRIEHLSCLKAMQDIANVSSLLGEKLYFDIIYHPATNISQATFEFKIWVSIRGDDRTVGVGRFIVGPQFGNLVDASLVRDWENEATIGYIAGNGQDENKVYASYRKTGVYNSPFYPIEIFGSESFGDDTAAEHNAPEGVTAAQLLLAENSAIESLTGTIINNEQMDFFNNIKPFDRVIAQYNDFQQFVDLDEYNVSVDNSGEEITIPLG